MDISLRQLEVFVAVAKIGHVTNAGEELGMTQAAVSLNLAHLERQLKGNLFDRIGKKLILNDRGRLLLQEAAEVLDRAKIMLERVTSRPGDPAGILRIGASTTIGNYLLPAVIGSFSRRYRKARIDLVVGNTSQIEDELAAGHLDLGLIEGPAHKSGLVAKDWRGDELVIIVSPSSPLSAKKKVTVRDLARAAWLAREQGSGTREIFERAMQAVGVRPELKFELGHTEAIKQAVIAGMGVACLSKLAVAREVAAGLLSEINHPLNLQRRLQILLRQGSQETPLQQAMLAYLFRTEFLQE